MGFFSNLLKSVGNAIGVAIEKVGEFLPGGLGQVIEDVGFSIQCSCDFGKTKWSKESSGDDTARAHQHLSMVKSEVEDQATRQEKEMIAACIETVTTLLDMLNKPERQIEILPEEKIAILKETYSTQIRKQLSGIIMKHVKPGLSFQNAECAAIFGLLSDVYRSERASAYQDRLLQEACLKFKSKSKIVLRECLCEIRDIVENERQRQEADFEEKKVLLRQLREKTLGEQQIDMDRADAAILQAKLIVLTDVAAMKPQNPGR